MWTVNVMVDNPISNHLSLENVCKDFRRCFSARLEMDNRNHHLANTVGVGVGKITYYRCTFSGFPSALRVSRPISISAFSSTVIFINANLAAALRC